MEILKKEALGEYEAFVASHPKGHFTQSVMWGKVKSAWNFEAVVSRDGEGNIVGAIGVLVRKVPMFPYTIMYAPRGPVCDVHDENVIKDLVDGIKELAKRNNAYIFRVDPDVKSDDEIFTEIMKKQGFAIKEESKTFDAIQPRYVFRLDVEGKTEDEVMALFESKTRYNIRVALKHGVEVKIAPREELETFYNIMIETGMRDNFVTRSLSYFQKMYDSLGEHIRLYMAYYEGKAIAGTLAIHYGDKVWYLYGASSNSYRNVMPNYLLQWSMIQWAVETGARIYDFRGVAGILEKDHPLYGLYRFKKGFNGEFTEFTGEMSIVFKPFANKMINVAEKLHKKYIKFVYKLKNRGK